MSGKGAFITGSIFLIDGGVLLWPTETIGGLCLFGLFSVKRST